MTTLFHILWHKWCSERVHYCYRILLETANMSGNGEKFCRQRQEQQRPSFSFHSCPVFISSSPSRISFSSSHGRNSLSTKEKETRIHLTSINKFSGRKQCLKDSTRNKTYSDDIRRCKSTESIRYLNVDEKSFHRTEGAFEIVKQRLKPKIWYSFLTQTIVGSIHFYSDTLDCF